jgi:hypothetical protein
LIFEEGPGTPARYLLLCIPCGEEEQVSTEPAAEEEAVDHGEEEQVSTEPAAEEAL